MHLAFHRNEQSFLAKNALESIIIDFYCGSIKIFKQSNFMFLIILYLYNLYVYRCFNNQFIILVDFWIQIFSIEKEQDAQKQIFL